MSLPVTFWFEFASTYSYLSVMRIDAEAEKRGVQVNWKPFLLGPMFKAHGWNTSPFVVYPKKGRNMWRDVERRAKKYGLAFNRPDPSDPRDFPAHSVLAARIALVGLDESWGKQFCRNVYVAQPRQTTNFASAPKPKTHSQRTFTARRVLRSAKSFSGAMTV